MLNYQGRSSDTSIVESGSNVDDPHSPFKGNSLRLSLFDPVHEEVSLIARKQFTLTSLFSEL